ncbi:MAG: PKD domain-containing protein [Chloroflexota bacterium]|nr:PKD domain-containing protein [Chloroflexota bacterium]
MNMKLTPCRTKWVSFLTVFILSCMILCTSCGLFNNHPVISSVQSEREWVDVSNSTVFECVASDEDGDELTYEWTADDGNISGEGSTVSWTAPNKPGIYEIVVRVVDGRGGEATMGQTIEVRVNQPPVIERLMPEKPVVVKSASISIECTAADPDGDELTYQWTATGGDISEQGSTVTWTAPDAVDTYTITVKVIDSRGGETSDEVEIKTRKPG